jgi:hypothetical protein
MLVESVKTSGQVRLKPRLICSVPVLPLVFDAEALKLWLNAVQKLDNFYMYARRDELRLAVLLDVQIGVEFEP